MEWLFRKRMFGMLRHTLFIKWNNKILFYTYHLHQVEQRNLSDVCKKTWLKSMVQKWEKEEKEWKEWKKRKEKEKKTLFQAKKIFNHSPTGNWTRVFRVTGGNTNHYTTADLMFMEELQQILTCKSHEASARSGSALLVSGAGMVFPEALRRVPV